MIEIPKFEVPSWLNSQDSATIQQRMMNNLPDGLDKTEGGFPWDMTKPTAMEKSEALQFHLVESLRQMYSFWATSGWLDLHAKEQAITRKAAAYAGGEVNIQGIVGTVIPEGFVFMTKATATVKAKLYETVNAAIIEDSGIANIQLKAAEPGAEYNTPENTVCLMYQPIEGIEIITNKEVITGGADEESDDDLRQRVILAERNGSHTGCDTDYERWALEVPGVGSAKTDPLWNGRGTVRVIIGDTNGEKANDTLMNRVYEHIVSPKDRSQRKAPIGATVTIDTVNFYDIDIKYSISVVMGAKPAVIHEDFKDGVLEYFAGDARKDMAVSYNRIRGLIEGIEGVQELKSLEIRAAKTPDAPKLEATQFITIPLGYYPDLGKFERTEG